MKYLIPRIIINQHFGSIVISIVSLAAGVALFFGILYKNSNQNKGISDYWPYEEGLPVQMGDSTVYNPAMNAFKLEQWEQSYREFSRFSSDTAIYFAGLCKYQLKSLESASGLLQKIPRNSVFFMDATIRIALIKLQQGNKSEAKKILEEIGADKEHKHYELASQFLKRYKSNPMIKGVVSHKSDQLLCFSIICFSKD